MLLDVLGVDERDDGVERDLLQHGIVEEEGLGDRHRVGEPAGLDQDVVDTVDELADHVEQVRAHRRDAADAAVAHLDDLFVGRHHEIRVDVDLTELVLDHGDAPAVLLAQDVVEQCRLPRAEEAGEDRDRQLHCVPRPRRPLLAARSLALARSHPHREIRLTFVELILRCLPTTSRPGAPHRGSSGSPCTGRGCRPAPRGPTPRRGAASRRSSSWTATISPGVQKPHCTAPASRNACCTGWRSSPSASPSMVTIDVAVGLPGSHQARAHEDVVHQHRARSALALLAGVLRTPQLQALAQDVEQALAPPDVVDLVVATVDRQPEPHRFASPSDSHTHPRQRRASTPSA